MPVRQPLALIRVLWTLARHDAVAPFLAPFLPGRRSATWGRVARWITRPEMRARRPGERLTAALQTLGPSFIKLGQALSVRADLVGAEVAEDLGLLRDRLPPFSAAEARAMIAAELGRDVEAVFEHFDNRPVAAASIAQVHFAVTREADGVPGVAVAVKVLRPGIEHRFQRDLALFRWLAETVERWFPRARRLRPVASIETLAESVAIEMDLRLEAAAAAELAENFDDEGEFRVPAVDWERTARRVLTVHRVAGVSLGDRAGLLVAGHDPAALAGRLIRSFLRQALDHGFFHADLHQGNLFVDPDGTLVGVDFGIMGRLDQPTRKFLAEILIAFIDGDYRRAAAAHFAAGYVPPGKTEAEFARACRSVGAPIHGRPLSEISIGRLLAQLFRITESFEMATQPQLLLLQKTMVTVEGVARALDPDVNFWEVSAPVVKRWLSDNLGPEARMVEAAAGLGATLRRLPALIKSVDTASVALRQIADAADPPSRGSAGRWLLLGVAIGAVGWAMFGG